MHRRVLHDLIYGASGGVLIIVGIVLESIPLLVTVAGVVMGIGAGFLVTLVLTYAQRPSLTVVNANDEYNNMGTKWVHLSVRNTSAGLLGMGQADDCRASLVFDEGKRKFEPKWAGRPNPHRTQLVVSPQGVQAFEVADRHLFDQAKSETLFTEGEPKLLDVAYKFLGNPNCYVSVPEHFVGAGPAVVIAPLPERAFGEGPHPFTVELRNRSDLLVSKRFILRNKPGTGPEGLTIEDWPQGT